MADSECRHIFCKEQGLLSAASTRGAATEFYQQGARRLGLVSSLLAGVLAFVLALGYLQYEVFSWTAPPDLGEARLRQVLLLVLSLAMALVTRSRRLTPGALTRIGLGYQLAGAAVMAWGFFAADVSKLVEGHLTWLGVWILLFPLIAPANTRANIIAALICASFAPLAFGLSCVFDGAPETLSSRVIVNAFLPNYICAFLGIVPASLMVRMAVTLNKAQSEAKQVGTYNLIKVLGEGGMGEVWEAEHQLLRRRAALKIIKSGLLGKQTPEEREAFIRRFQREAAATAALRSPHTVSLFDYGQTADGAFYYVMERLDGLDLEELVERFGPVPTERAIAIGMQACDSLAEAHELGMIHRDIKPSNLFLCRLGPAYDFLKILDFGLVTVDSSADEESLAAGATRLTKAGFIIGTPSFLSPEQAGGKDLDARSDLYSLACVLYFLVTGHPVFDDQRPMQIVLDHIQKAPTPPSQRLRRAIDPAFEGLLLECLAKDPKQRPANAAALRERLAACLGERRWGRARAREWWAEREGQTAESFERRPPSDPTTLEGSPLAGIEDETAPMRGG